MKRRKITVKIRPYKRGARVAPRRGSRALADWPRSRGLLIPGFETRKGSEVRDGVLVPEIRDDVLARVLRKWTREVPAGVQIIVPEDDWPRSETIESMFGDVADKVARFFVLRVRELVHDTGVIDTGLFLSEWESTVHVSTFGLQIALRNRAPYRYYVHPKGSPKERTFINRYLPYAEQEAQDMLASRLRKLIRSKEYKAALRRAIFES